MATITGMVQILNRYSTLMNKDMLGWIAQWWCNQDSGLKGLYTVLLWCTFNALINVTGNESIRFPPWCSTSKNVSNGMVNRAAEMLLHYSEDTCTYWWTDDSLKMEYCTSHRHYSGD